MKKKPEKVTLVNPFRPSHKNLSYTALFYRNMTLKSLRTNYSNPPIQILTVKGYLLLDDS